MNRRRFLGLVILLLGMVICNVACGNLENDVEGGLEETEGGNGDADGGENGTGDETDNGASDDLVFEYHREGGIAGFCDVVMVYANGEVTVASCAADPPEIINTTRLTEEQQAMVEDWVQTLESFDTEQADDAVADAMTVSVEFHGEGEAEASAEDIQAIQDLAVELISQAPTQ